MTDSLKFNKDVIDKVEKLFQPLGITFCRIFGSIALGASNPSDIDLLIGPKLLDIENLSQLSIDLEELFKKKVDLVQFRINISPYLVRELARNNIILWEEPTTGRTDYAVLLDRYLAVAEDDLLSFPKELRDENQKRVIERLSVP